MINRTDWANALVEYVPYVVLRMVQSDHDNPTQDYQRYGADPRVIIQCGNEANGQHDTDHWLRQMRDAEADGRHVVIFNDSVGATEDAMWLERRPALEYAKAHGHFAGLHAYGIVTDGGDIYHPMTEDSGWRWFAGRYEHLYSLMPPSAQPDLLLTECGSGGYQTNATREQWLADVQRMETIARRSPFLKAFMWWTAGASTPALGFVRDSLDTWL